MFRLLKAIFRLNIKEYEILFTYLCKWDLVNFMAFYYTNSFICSLTVAFKSRDMLL